MQTPTRSPGRALLKTPSRMQPHVQIESFAPALPATIFASDPSLRALINRDTSNIDFSLRTLQQTIIDRNRSFKAKLHDFVIEGKKIEKQTAELAEQQRVLENLLAKEKGEAETGGQKVKVLEGRRKDMQAQLDSLKADIAEWQAKINLNMQTKKVLEEEIAQQQAKNKPEVELFEEVLGLQIRGKSRNLISIIFTKIDPNSYSRRFSFDLDLSRTQYTVSDVSPPIPQSVLQIILNNFNESKGFNQFIKEMRVAFIDNCLGANSANARQNAMTSA